jgi:sugar fermentation stimulation protein A
MRFPTPLVGGRLVKRYKRFLADVVLDDGREITAHCANPGSMLGLATPGARVMLSLSDNPARKLAYSWELVEVGGVWVGINTAHPNALVAEAIEAGVIAELTGHQRLRREVKYGKNSRVDILLETDGRPDVLVEVKNVHLMRRPGLAEFPDSVTARGAKHLVELADAVEAGRRAVMLYLVQYPGAERLAFAADIDPAYAEAFRQASARGVEAYAYACEIDPVGIEVTRRIPLVPSE